MILVISMTYIRAVRDNFYSVVTGDPSFDFS